MTPPDPAACRTAGEVPAAVAALLSAAAADRASDVHLLPDAEGLLVRFRIDGRLEERGRFAPAVAPNVVGRLKVLAGLLTYDNDRPQEGRIRAPADAGGDADHDPAPQMRVSTFPTIHGEKAVVRLFAPAGTLTRLDDLSLTPAIVDGLKAAVRTRGGLVLIAGPAGSGKTTTAYALLRESAGEPGEPPRSLATLEDPVEAVIPGVSQSQTRPAAGFDFPTGLRSLLRQDPEVLLVGEIRDAETARIALGAALTGHLVLTTFHAGTARGAAVRLRETGAEPYQIRHGVRAILTQRLLRRLCYCAEESTAPGARLGLPLPDAAASDAPVKIARGCERCGGTGYRGRFPVAALDRGDGGDGTDDRGFDGEMRTTGPACSPPPWTPSPAASPTRRRSAACSGSGRCGRRPPVRRRR